VSFSELSGRFLHPTGGRSGARVGFENLPHRCAGGLAVFSLDTAPRRALVGAQRLAVPAKPPGRAGSGRADARPS